MSDTAEPIRSGRRGRGGGGAARRAERTAVSFETAKTISRNIPNLEMLSDEALDIIEANAETVLEEIGVVCDDCGFRKVRETGLYVQMVASFGRHSL